MEAQGEMLQGVSTFSLLNAAENGRQTSMSSSPHASGGIVHCGCAELRQMRIKADTDKKEAALAEASMQSIEAAAKKAYEKDLAAQQACARANGDWVSLVQPVLASRLPASPLSDVSRHVN